MDFGYFPDGYLVRSFPETKDEIYNTFSLFAIEAAHVAVSDKKAKLRVTLQ